MPTTFTDTTRKPWDRPRLAVRVKPAALREIRRGHPWVFDRSITGISTDGQAGDLAVVFDDRRKFAAIGLFDPTSPIRIRLLHNGRPCTIDDQWLCAAIAKAFDRRRSLDVRHDVNSFRVVHGENDGLGGLVIDLYDRHAVVKIYSSAWLDWLPALSRAIEACLVDRVDTVVVRAARNVTGLSEADQVLRGTRPTAPVPILENGLVFHVDLMFGHKTGHFLDQRANRSLVGDYAEGRSVLDVFSCTGGFAVHAAAGGAVDVTAIDVSAQAIDQAAANMAANGLGVGFHTVTGDAFDEMRRLVDQQRRFDMVIVDPPSMAGRQAQAASAIDAYRRLSELGADLTAEGGLLYLASCTARVSEADFRTASLSGIARAGRQAQVLATTGHDVDHPVGFEQGRYLKGLMLSL